MNLEHRFWQVLALSLATMVTERGWLLTGILVLAVGWLAGLYVGLG